MEQSTKKVLGGCCLGFSILGVIVLGIAGFVGYKVYSTINRFASKTPVTIPAIKPTEAEVKAVDDKLNGITKALLAGEEGVFYITAHDLNVLIASRDDCKDLRGKVNMKISKGVVTAETCLPLDKLDVSLLKGRYFSGELDLKLKIVNGKPKVWVADARVGGRSIKGYFILGDILAKIQKKELIAESHGEIDPGVKKLLQNVDSFEIQDEAIEIKTKKGAKFISKKPAPVHMYQPTQTELAEVRQKADRIRQNAKARVRSNFEVSEHELNVFLGGLKNSRYPDMKADVSIKDGIVTAKGCFPLDELNIPEYRGMYFNGDVKLKLGTENGKVAAYVEDVIMGGTSMKGLLKDKLNKNVLKHYYGRDDTEFSRLINTLKNADVRDGKVFLESR